MLPSNRFQGGTEGSDDVEVLFRTRVFAGGGNRRGRLIWSILQSHPKIRPVQNADRFIPSLIRSAEARGSVSPRPTPWTGRPSDHGTSSPPPPPKGSRRRLGPGGPSRAATSSLVPGSSAAAAAARVRGSARPRPRPQH